MYSIILSFVGWFILINTIVPYTLCKDIKHKSQIPDSKHNDKLYKNDQKPDVSISKYINGHYLRDIVSNISMTTFNGVIDFDGHGHIKSTKNISTSKLLEICNDELLLELEVDDVNMQHWCDVMLKNLDHGNYDGKTWKDEESILKVVKFSDLSGWKDDNFEDAMENFLATCDHMKLRAQNTNYITRLFTTKNFIFGDPESWLKVCDIAKVIPREYSMAFFELYFSPLSVRHKQDGKYSDLGLFTGYYEASIRGSMEKTDQYKYAIHTYPEECSSGFCYTRDQINNGALNDRKLELCYARDYRDLMGMQIQGSGMVHMDDGSILRLSYNGGNGYKLRWRIGYFSENSDLLPQSIDPNDRSAIRKWLAQNPYATQYGYNYDENYVFFKINHDVMNGPIGGMGMPLIASRSLAIDRSFVPHATPIWIDVPIPMKDDRSFDKKHLVKMRRLMMAHDVGSAINGQIRADIFYGVGSKAEFLASKQAYNGKYYLLIPKSVINSITPVLPKKDSS